MAYASEEKARAYRLAHRERERELERARYHANLEKSRARQRRKMRTARARDPEGSKAKLHTWRKANPDRIREYNRKNFRKVRYGLEDGEFESMYELQGGRCAICSKKFPPLSADSARGTHVDHDHRTGKVRALLCARCNFRLGVLEKDDWVPKAEAYLRRHGSKK